MQTMTDRRPCGARFEAADETFEQARLIRTGNTAAFFEDIDRRLMRMETAGRPVMSQTIPVEMIDPRD